MENIYFIGTDHDFNSFYSAIKDTRTDYEGKLRRFESMKDDKARRNDKIFAHDKDLRQTYEWVNENRKLFRRPVHGPIVCDVVTNDVDASNYLEQHVKNTVLKSFVVECREDMNLLYREVREKRNWKININIVNQGTLEPVRRMYSDNKMKTLKERYGIAGYLDELFEAPPAILQALRNTANVHSVLIGGSKTSLNDDLGKFLSQKENGNGKQSFCMFVKEGPKAYKVSIALPHSTPHTRFHFIPCSLNFYTHLAHCHDFEIQYSKCFYIR